MLALRIDLLTGRYVATAYNDRTLAEWPPHPARVFSALVAAHHSAGTADAAEREALEWLAALSPPALCASGVSTRTSVPVFVPVNDVGLLPDFSGDVIELRSAEDSLGQLREGLSASGHTKSAEREIAKAEKEIVRQRARLESRVASALAVAEPTTAALEMAKAVLPESRRRQPRMFPSVSPHVPIVHLVWPEAHPTAADRASLDALARRVTRIGHSSSLVACRLVDDPPAIDWLPSGGGELVLRVTSAGQLQRLEEDFIRHREEQPRTLPSKLQPYTRPAYEAFTPVPVMGEDWILFRRVEGPALPTRRTADLAAALRETLMRFVDQPPREILTGHSANAEPSSVPHVAYLALPFVLGGPHADGSLLGVAVVLPRGATAEDRAHVLRAIGTWEQRSGQDEDDGEPPMVPLLLGRAGTLRLQRVRGAAPLRNLDPTLWCRESRSWATVTPIALDRNPGNLRARRAEEAARAVRSAVETIGQACRQIGLPSPESIGVSPLCTFRGPESSIVYPPFPKEQDRFRRVLVHADITFERPVRGPVLLGAGRYRGLGLCMPHRGGE